MLCDDAFVAAMQSDGDALKKSQRKTSEFSTPKQRKNNVVVLEINLNCRLYLLLGAATAETGATGRVDWATGSDLNELDWIFI